MAEMSQSDKEPDTSTSGTEGFRQKYSAFQFPVEESSPVSQHVAIFGFHGGAARRIYDQYLQDGSTSSVVDVNLPHQLTSKTIHVNNAVVHVFYHPDQYGCTNFRRAALEMMKQVSPGFTSFILAFDASRTRVSSDDIDFLSMFESLMGVNAFRNVSLVLLNVEELELGERTLTDYLNDTGNSSMGEICDRMNMRVVGVSTKNDFAFPKDHQRDELLTVTGSTILPYQPRTWQYYIYCAVYTILHKI